jgi:FkbM family methyltransferase
MYQPKKISLISRFINLKRNWDHSDDMWKRRLASYCSKLFYYAYRKPLKGIGMVSGVIFSKMPIGFSSQLKESLNLTTNMPPLSLGIKIVVDRSRDHARAQFCAKEKEALTCEWIKKYYKKGDIIYDIGANIGAVSLVSALHLKKDCKIYSFEPLPSTFSMLFKNIMINSCDKVIVPLNIALSNKVEITQFNLSSIESGTSGHSVGNSTSGEGKSLTVLTQTLDNLIDCYHIEQADHIKIDVDGIDYEVLLGGEKNILNKSTLKTILIEKNDKEEQIRSLLKKYSFIEVELKDPGRTKYENIGFVREV